MKAIRFLCSSTSPLPTLLSTPKEWPLLYPNGRAAVFGWREPTKEGSSDPFAALEFDSNKAAFGPDAVTAPAGAAAISTSRMVVGLLDAGCAATSGSR